MTDWKMPPEEIERKSFAIIEAEAPDHDWPPEAWRIIRRMVHASGDFEYVRSVRLHPGAVAAGIMAVREGRTILTDTRMAQAGISRRRLARFGSGLDCLIDRPETARRAEAQGTTRAAAAVDLALEASDGGIYVVGNAPTALFRIIELVRSGWAGPELIVGLPVGFVNAAEAKEALLEIDVPYITALGRKGGSNVAASVINALAELAAEAGHDQA